MTRKPSTDQLTLDFDSAYRAEHAQLISALKITGLARLTPLARLVFNMQKKHGTPLAWPVSRYAAEFDVHERTVQNWLAKLASIGLVEITYRPRQRGGQDTNLVAINWLNVRKFAVDRGELAQGEKLSPRPAVFSPRGENFSPPIKESPSVVPSVRSNTTTTALPHEPLPHAAALDLAEGRNEEEIFLQELAGEVRRHVTGVPRQLDAALRAALDHGVTREGLWDRCKWFAAHQREWAIEHRPGAFYTGLVDARPGMRASDGWPYRVR